MEHSRLVLAVHVTVLRTLLLDLSVVTRVQSERVGCTWGRRYLMLLNNDVGAMVRDVDSEV